MSVSFVGVLETVKFTTGHLGRFGFTEADITVMTDGSLADLGSDVWPTKENIVRTRDLPLPCETLTHTFGSPQVAQMKSLVRDAKVGDVFVFYCTPSSHVVQSLFF